MAHIKNYHLLSRNKGKNAVLKPFPTTGKVAAKPSEGASVSKHERTKMSVSRYARMGFTEQY